MKILRLNKKNLGLIVKHVREILVNDGLAVIPSDTVYGLVANACSSKAVNKVYDFKGRQFGKGISIFLNNLEQIKKYADYNQKQWEIIKTLLPGPFTVVLKSRHQVAKETEHEDKTIGIRVIENELIKQLTRALNFPITATSANLSGKGPHYSIDSFLATLSEKKKEMINLVVDIGELPRRPVSTVVRLVGDQIKVLREGVLSLKLLFRGETKSEIETKKLAQKIFKDFLSEGLRNKAVTVIMKGDLGSGKTVFAKGIGELINLNLTSPTFTLLDEYLLLPKTYHLQPKNLYHLDLYRIESEEEILELKLEQFLRPGNLLLIEWGEKLSIFESLKTKQTVFYLLQIVEIGINKRAISFYRI